MSCYDYCGLHPHIFDDTNISYAFKILFQQIQSKSVILHLYFHLLFALTFMGKDGKGH